MSWLSLTKLKSKHLLRISRPTWNCSLETNATCARVPLHRLNVPATHLATESSLLPCCSPSYSLRCVTLSLDELQFLDPARTRTNVVTRLLGRLSFLSPGFIRKARHSREFLFLVRQRVAGYLLPLLCEFLCGFDECLAASVHS